MTTKRIDATIKSYSEKDAGGPGEFEAVLSAPTLDRDGEVIKAGAFAPLPDHINIDLDHSFKALDIVASGQPFYDGDVLKIKGTFAGTAKGQEARQLVTEGHLRALSVTFMGAQYEDVEGVPHISKAELMNATFAAVPANREALVLSAKQAHETKATKALVAELVEYITTNPDDPDVAALRDALAPSVEEISTDTDPEPEATAEEAVAPAPADVEVALALAELELAEADLALS